MMISLKIFIVLQAPKTLIYLKLRHVLKTHLINSVGTSEVFQQQDNMRPDRATSQRDNRHFGRGVLASR